MKVLRRILVGFGLVVLLMALLLFVFYEMETRSSSFSSYYELTAKAPIEESEWFPRWMPKSAFDIKESHNIDTNYVWIVSHFDKSDRFYEVPCTSVNKDRLSIPRFEYVRRFPRFVHEAYKIIEKDKSLRF